VDVESALQAEASWWRSGLKLLKRLELRLVRAVWRWQRAVARRLGVSGPAGEYFVSGEARFRPLAVLVSLGGAWVF